MAAKARNGLQGGAGIPGAITGPAFDAVEWAQGRPEGDRAPPKGTEAGREWGLRGGWAPRGSETARRSPTEKKTRRRNGRGGRGAGVTRRRRDIWFLF